MIRTWQIVAAVLSSTGIVSILVCALYFLMVFPVRVGTTLMGYLILAGLASLYSINFAFLFPASLWICWLRRFGIGLCYTIIFSGFFVKVLTTWKLMKQPLKGSCQPHDLHKYTQPSRLLSISFYLILIQVVVSAVCLAIFPPRPALYDGVLQCTPSSSRLVVLGSDYFISIVSLLTIVSALYLACIVFLVFVFACLTWKCPDQNHEPRWIFFNTFSITLIWFAWSLFRVELGYDEMSIVCANFACASVIMLSLFVRKLYLFSKISRQIRAQKQQLKQRLRNANPFPPSLYGTMSNKSIFLQQIGAKIVWEQAAVSSLARHYSGSLHHKTATKAPFEDDTDADTISTCGSVKSAASSVQVQGDDLYPMDIYDGGSQFAPSSFFAKRHGCVEDSAI